MLSKKRIRFTKCAASASLTMCCLSLKSSGPILRRYNPPIFTRFMLSSPSGKILEVDLNLEGFGLSRYILGHCFYQLAQARGATFKLHTTVQDVLFSESKFKLKLSDGETVAAPAALGLLKRNTYDQPFQGWLMAWPPHLLRSGHRR